MLPVAADHTNICKLELHGALLSQIVEMVRNSSLIAPTNSPGQTDALNPRFLKSILPETNTQVTAPEKGFSSAANVGSTEATAFSLVTDHFAAAPKAVTLPIFDVPHHRSSNFFGREKELEVIDKILTPNNLRG